jgi:hypothetical protein
MSQAYILGHLVTTIFNDSFPNSRISEQLAAMLRVSHSRTMLPISANMGSGSLTSLVEFEVDDQLHSDVVLGKNWFADYREYMISENLLTSTQVPCETQKRDTGGLNLILFLVCHFTFFQTPSLTTPHQNIPKTMFQWLLMILSTLKISQ